MAVRRESVRLDVEGNFAEKVLADAAALEVLKRQLKDFSGQSVQTSRATQALERDVDNTNKKFRQGSKDLDTYTGRLGLLAAAIGAVAPAVAPLGGVGVAGLAGVANDAGMAATAVGSLVLALHGVMPALKAVNKAALDPTAANLRAASLAMEQLSPAARKFVVELQSMEPLIQKIQGAAASGWFPGLAHALENLKPLAPTIAKIFHDVGEVGGNLLAQGAKALAGPEWRNFFQFIDTEAPKALAAMGHILGSLAHGLSQLWMAFAPLNGSFNSWLVGVAKGFDSWATGLSQTQGFADFLAYVHENGPKVAAAVGAIASAVVEIVKAAAPLGGPTLDAITALANALAIIAKSPLGTPILGLLQIASAARLAASAMEALKVSMLLGAGAGALARRSTGGLALTEGIAGGAAASRSNYTGPAIAAVLGGHLANSGFNAVGNLLAPGQSDLGSQNNVNAIIDSIRNGNRSKWTNPLSLIGFNPDHLGDKSGYQNADAGLAQLVASGDGAKAADIFAKINAQVSDAAQYFPAYESAVQAAGDATKVAATKTKALRDANHQVADSFINLSQAMKKPTLSLDQLVSRWRSQAAAESALGKNIATAVARGANPQALSQVVDHLGPQAGLAIRQLAHGGKKGIDDLNAAFRTGQKAAGVYNKSLNTLTQTLLGIPKHVNPVITILSHDEPLRATIRELENLHDKTVNVWVKTFTPGKPTKPHPGHIDPNTGTYIPGSALGGTIPHDGLPYADRYLYMLAPGEEVVSNRHGQADKHRALLKAINADRAGSGATVGWRGGGGHSTVTHRIKVEVDAGSLDLRKAKHQLNAIVREISRDEVEQDRAFNDR